MRNIVFYFFTFLIFALLFIGFFHPIRAMDQDLGRHLLMGKIILATKNVPKVNLLTFTYPNFPFINHHWLSEVVFYLVFKLVSFPGLLIFSTVLFITAFTAVFFYASKKTNTIALTIASLLYLPLLFERTDIRPELFSFFFLSLFIVILYQYKSRFTKWIFLLPALELLWVNIHIYYIIGLFVFGLFLIDNLLTKYLKKQKLIDRDLKILVLVFLACCFATLINPNGLSGALYAFHVFQNYGYTIQENQSVYFLMQYGFPQPALPYIVGSIILLFTALCVSWRQTKLIDWLLSFAFTLIAVSAVRNFPLFAFTTFIPFAYSLTNTIDKLSLKSRFKNVVILVLFLLLILEMQIAVSQKGFGFGNQVSAHNGANFYLSNNLKGPILNNFDIGSYLEYRLYPKDLPAGRQEITFIDGRPEAYPVSFFQNVYIPMQQDPQVFAKTDQQYRFNTIFYTHTDQTPWAEKFISTILDNKQWKTVYLDDSVIILAKQNQENKGLIDKFGMDKNSIHTSNIDKNNLISLLKLANFYNTAGLTKQAVENYKDILNINPNFCPALQNISILLEQQNNPTAQIYASRFQQSCQ